MHAFADFISKSVQSSEGLPPDGTHPPFDYQPGDGTADNPIIFPNRHMIDHQPGEYESDEDSYVSTSSDKEDEELDPKPQESEERNFLLRSEEGDKANQGKSLDRPMIDYQPGDGTAENPVIFPNRHMIDHQPGDGTVEKPIILPYLPVKAAEKIRVQPHQGDDFIAQRQQKEQVRMFFRHRQTWVPYPTRTWLLFLVSMYTMSVGYS